MHIFSHNIISTFHSTPELASCALEVNPRSENKSAISAVKGDLNLGSPGPNGELKEKELL